MSKYVDVEKILNDKGRATRFPNTSDLYYHESILQYAPAEDVAPVIHAHWIIHKQEEIWMGILVTTFECSNCHKTVRDIGFGRYCPNCGAKMDEKEN